VQGRRRCGNFISDTVYPCPTESDLTASGPAARSS